MTNLQPLRWGIIGVGRFGRIHARAVQSTFGLDLVAICNRNVKRLEQAAHNLRVDRTYEDYRAMLDAPDIDVVSITTHVTDHHPVAVEALASGKHVLLEKPMAFDTNQCRAIVDAAASATGKFMVGHICRFDPRVSLAKRAIEEGRLGRIVSMHAKRNLPQAPGWLRLDKTSPLMGDGIHDADLMMWFLDQAPERVYGRYVRFNDFVHPDVGWAMLEFGNDAIGVVETNWGLPTNVPTVIDARLEVAGTEGMLTIDCSNTGFSVLDSDGLKSQDTAYWPEQHGALVGVLREEITYFADCIRQDKAPDVIRAHEAARAVGVMEAAEESARSGQPVAFADTFAD